MLYEGEVALANDLRTTEFNMITLPIGVSIGDYIDIRMTVPSGQDYIVISKKKVLNISGETITMNLTEDEILIMNGAIVEGYIMKASNIYAIKYIDEIQTQATPTYPVSTAVANLILSDPNIVETAKNQFKSRYSNDQRSNINGQVDQYINESLNNVEQGIRDQIENAKKAREQYLSSIGM
jgi:hypothetical protein